MNCLSHFDVLKHRHCGGFGMAVVLGVAIAGAQEVAVDGRAEPEILSLEAFILEETAGLGDDTLMQTSRPTDSVFLGEMSIMNTPRSVTLLTPEAMKQLAVKDFSDLSRVGAGMTRPNIFGLPGLPFMQI